MARTVAAEAQAILRHLQEGYTYWVFGSTDLQQRAIERLAEQGKVVKRYAWSTSRGRWEPVYYAEDDPRADDMPATPPNDPYDYFAYVPERKRAKLQGVAK